jgi:hypothetical protein
MRTLKQGGIEKVLQGVTDMKQYGRYASSKGYALKQ